MAIGPWAARGGRGGAGGTAEQDNRTRALATAKRWVTD
jgi:hypothetical protein